MEPHQATPLPVPQSPLQDLTSPSLDKLIPDLIRFQKAVQNPDQNKTGHVYKDGKFMYSFKYATLDRLFESTQELLADCKLAITQIPREKEPTVYELVTLLLHTSGQWIKSVTPILTDGRTNQQFGSALTYAKRYAYAAILRIAGDEDDDGNAADGNQQVTGDNKPPPRRKPGRPRKTETKPPEEEKKTARRKTKRTKRETKPGPGETKVPPSEKKPPEIKIEQLIPNKHRRTGKYRWEPWAREMAKRAVSLADGERVFELAEANTEWLVMCHTEAEEIHDKLLEFFNKFYAAEPAAQGDKSNGKDKSDQESPEGKDEAGSAGDPDAPPKGNKS